MVKNRKLSVLRKEILPSSMTSIIPHLIIIVIPENFVQKIGGVKRIKKQLYQGRMRQLVIPVAVTGQNKKYGYVSLT